MQWAWYKSGRRIDDNLGHNIIDLNKNKRQLKEEGNQILGFDYNIMQWI